jgi:hypothetical protein
MHNKLTVSETLKRGETKIRRDKRFQREIEILRNI